MTNMHCEDIHKRIHEHINKNIRQTADLPIGYMMGYVQPSVPTGALLYSGNLVDRSTPPKPLALNGQTEFAIGSISKVFTTGIALGLYEWNSPFWTSTLTQYLISDWIKLSAYVGSITFMQCAGYASGLPQDNGHCNAYPHTGYPANIRHSLADLFDCLSTYSPGDTQPHLVPGQTYTYSNIAFALMGMALADISRLNDLIYEEAYLGLLHDYCKKFDVNAGKKQSTSVWPFEAKGLLPLGYDKDSNPVSGPPTDAIMGPAGGIISTGDDMLKFLLYQMADSSSYALQTPWSTQLTDYCANRNGAKKGPLVAAGWFIMPMTAGGQDYNVVWKNGGVSGFSSWIGFVQRPDAATSSTHGCFFLTNSTYGSDYGVALMRLMLGATPAEIEAPIPELPVPDFSLD